MEDESVNDAYLDPAVRAAVFATVTREEAVAVMNGEHYKPWTDAAVLMMAEGFDRAVGKTPGSLRSITHGMRGLVDVNMATLHGPTSDKTDYPSGGAR